MELQLVKSMQALMTRRILGMWPKRREDWLTYAQRTAHYGESLWKEANIPPWDEKLAS